MEQLDEETVDMGNVFERELQEMESEDARHGTSGRLQRQLDLCEKRMHEVRVLSLHMTVSDSL